MATRPSSPTGPTPRILFLNQVAGPLFRELAEDVAKSLGPCTLLTGHTQDLARPVGSELTVIPAPDYDRRSLIRRAWSWLRYFFPASRLAWKTPRRTLLFLVSNPPFLPLVGWCLRQLRGQRYAVLVYDIYPDLLVNTGRLAKHGPPAWAWRRFNRLVWDRADIVFTIGDYMARNVERMLPPPGARRSRVVVIPNWADADFIKPLPKEQNWFAQKHQQIGKLTVLYSGNLGATHDLETLLSVAGSFKDDPSLAFLIIGAGAKWHDMERTIQREDLTNVTLLPFQPEKDLPFSLTTGDIAVITLEKGIEGVSVPSKTYYAMAAGAALLGISHAPNELTDIIERHQCGLNVEPGDAAELRSAIRRFRGDRDFLDTCRRNARGALEQSFSRANTRAYAEALRPLVASGL